ncbi:MAG: hypothetical protein HQL01_02580 [Nitrospirae bacterium]|nr:hypothetical protein [Nitrospirota bacterium]
METQEELEARMEKIQAKIKAKREEWEKNGYPEQHCAEAKAKYRNIKESLDMFRRNRQETLSAIKITPFAWRWYKEQLRLKGKDYFNEKRKEVMEKMGVEIPDPHKKVPKKEATIADIMANVMKI